MDLRIPEPEDGLAIDSRDRRPGADHRAVGRRKWIPRCRWMSSSPSPAHPEGCSRASIEVDIRVKVIPKSSKTELAGYLPDGTWKIKVAAAPEKGKANRALVEFLAEHLDVAKSRIRIMSGETSQLKRIHVDE